MATPTAPPTDVDPRRTNWGADELKVHPHAELFSPMTAEEYAGLLASVRANGILTPLVLFEGMVLDGRHRLVAAKEAGLAVVPTTTYQGDEPLTFVVAANITRRHLTMGQRSLMAARLATMAQGARTDLAPKDAMSQSDAATLLKVSRRSVQKAKGILEYAPPEVVNAVDAGEMKLGAAEKKVVKPSPARRTSVRKRRPCLSKRSLAVRMEHLTAGLDRAKLQMWRFTEHDKKEMVRHPKAAAWFTTIAEVHESVTDLLRLWKSSLTTGGGDDEHQDREGRSAP